MNIKCQVFRKPDRGLQLLINWGFVDSNPQAIAKLFLGRRGLSKQMIGEFLGTLHSSFHASVLDYFISEIDMFDMEIDVALRHMLSYFRLPGEAQKIDHIMQVDALLITQYYFIYICDFRRLEKGT